MTRGRAGFTLVELVVATALSALLLTVALAVVRGLNRQPPTPALTDTTGPIARQLQWDLANAVVLRTDDRGLTLGGYGSLDPATLEPTHLPAHVTYTLRPIDDRLWLVREASPLSGSGPATTDLLCGDVARFTVDAPSSPADLAAATRPAEEDPTPLPFQRLAHVRPVPRRVAIRITFAGRLPVEAVAYR